MSLQIVSIRFLWLSSIPVCVCVCVYHIFIHSSVGGHLGSFHSLAIVDIVAISTGVQVPPMITMFVSLGKYLVVQLLDQRIALFLAF